jgi:hypothetical protein
MRVALHLAKDRCHWGSKGRLVALNDSLASILHDLLQHVTQRLRPVLKVRGPMPFNYDLR